MLLEPLGSTPLSHDIQAFVDDIAARLPQWEDSGELTPGEAAIVAGKLDFARRRDAIPQIQNMVDLYGYGPARALFVGVDGQPWMTLTDLVDVTGCDYSELLDEFAAEIDSCEPGEQPDVDVLTWTRPGGGTAEIPLGNARFVFNVLSSRSPWAHEFRDAMAGVFRRAAIASGLADAIGVVEHSPDGTPVRTGRTLRDLLEAGGAIPTADEARERAFRGPVVEL